MREREREGGREGKRVKNILFTTNKTTKIKLYPTFLEKMSL